jgi:DNA-cytosine methyltransferase
MSSTANVKNVLSLFDGISCAQVALKRAGIQFDNYFASEVDKYAMQVTQANHPDTFQLGSVTDIKSDHLPRIDLLVGGSPCQGFSLAGKQLNFDDERSALFFEYLRLKKQLKPKYFLLENVAMKREVQDVISELMGCEPIVINSNLVSAQNRKRLYWTNIPNVTQPEDKGIVLADIIEDGYVDREKAFCVDQSYYKGEDGANLRLYCTKSRRQIVFLGDQMTEPYWVKTYTKNEREMIELKKQGLAIPGANIELNLLCKEKVAFRKLTPIECERLQTLPDNYTQAVSNTQRYKGLGNGFTVDVIAHIFKNLESTGN